MKKNPKDANPEFILASGSPRRKDMLNMIGLTPHIITSEVDETLKSTSAPLEASRLARLKAEAVYHLLDQKRWVLGADTIVYRGKKLMGKAENRESAFNMLKRLSGKNHKVVTAVTLITPEGEQIHYKSITKLKMIKAGKKMINHYLDKEEWKGVAGAYRIQEEGKVLIERMEGSLTNVIGLPIEMTIKILRKKGFNI